MNESKYRVKELREKAKMTQEELAKNAGISRVTLSGIESGTAEVATTKTLSKLAEALNVSIRDIFLP